MGPNSITASPLSRIGGLPFDPVRQLAFSSAPGFSALGKPFEPGRLLVARRASQEESPKRRWLEGDRSQAMIAGQPAGSPAMQPMMQPQAVPGIRQNDEDADADADIEIDESQQLPAQSHDSALLEVPSQHDIALGHHQQLLENPARFSDPTLLEATSEPGVAEAINNPAFDEAFRQNVRAVEASRSQDWRRLEAEEEARREVAAKAAAEADFNELFDWDKSP